MTDLIIQEQPQRSRIQVHQNITNHYVINFFDDVGPAYDYVEELALFKNAKEDDLIEIHVSNSGGSLETAIILYTAMRECLCPIICEIGSCASAATIFCLGADNWKINPMSNWMIHSASFQPGWGKIPDVEASVLATKKLVSKFVREVYNGFLTEEEFDDIINRRGELYFDAEELSVRLTSLLEHRQEEFELELKNFQDPLVGKEVVLTKGYRGFKKGKKFTLVDSCDEEGNVLLDDGKTVHVFDQSILEKLDVVE